MTIKLKHARQSLTATVEQASGPYDSMVRLFAQSARSAAPAQFALAVAIIFGAMFYTAIWQEILCGAAVLLMTAVRYWLGSAFLRLRDPEKSARLWRVFFILSEIGFGGAWALLIVELMHAPSERAHAFALIALMLAAGMIAVVNSAIPAAVGAGLAPILVAIVAFFTAGAPKDAIVLSLLCGGALLYFIMLSNRLHRSALAGLSYQAEKDALIAELEQAKLNSDEARRRAEGANLAKSRFLATMSHELRTPLNAILGFSEVMKAELFGPLNVPTYKEYSNDIHSSGQHLLMLINEILDLSRVEAGRYELKEEAVSLSGIVEECRHLLAMRAKNKSIAVLETVEDFLPRIWADERAVRQITLNLLSNAIKFTPQGGEITIKVGWTTAGGQYLSIRDNGSGIPEDEIPIVLSSFGRGSAAQKNAEEGSGLGLPIVRGLVELHGGEFKLQSKICEGTEVIVIFPPERVMNALPQLDPQGPSEAAGLPRDTRRGRFWHRRRNAA